MSQTVFLQPEGMQVSQPSSVTNLQERCHDGCMAAVCRVHERRAALVDIRLCVWVRVIPAGTPKVCGIQLQCVGLPRHKAVPMHSPQTPQPYSIPFTHAADVFCCRTGAAESNVSSLYIWPKTSAAPHLAEGTKLSLSSIFNAKECSHKVLTRPAGG